MNRTHNDAVKELEEKLQEENRTHDEAIKELEQKIADLDQETKHLSRAESIPNVMHYEPAQEEPEPVQQIDESSQETAEPQQEISTEVDQSERARELQERVRELLQKSKPDESEVPQETPKKKKRTLF